MFLPRAAVEPALGRRVEALERFLSDEAATVRLGQDLAHALRPGDVLALRGELGAGKTTLARSLIRTLAGKRDLEVPSPTFTMAQAYDGRMSVVHFDLYRLGSPDDLEELGFSEALAGGAAIVEWPERAGDRLPPPAIEVALTHRGDGRSAMLSGSGPAADRLARSLDAREFLSRAGRGEADRVVFTGDASARSYEIVSSDGGEPQILMNSPPLILGPPVRDGKPYAEIAHTAQSVHAFMALDRALLKAGIRAPEIFAADPECGFLLLEHLGTGSFLDDEGRPVADRYAAAAQLLAAVHGRDWPASMEIGDGGVHTVPPFDRDAMLIEAELLVDWYWPSISGEPVSETLREGFRAAWNRALDRISGAETSLVLRDFHSPNLIWRDDRLGHDRLGVIDFQDALIGPAAYDVAALAMDARVTVPPEIERSTVSAYEAARSLSGSFDADAFRAAYATMAAQRNSKVLGIFVRLDRRDGKPQYIKHLPRIRDYLARALAHPALGDLADFYRANGLAGNG